MATRQRAERNRCIRTGQRQRENAVEDHLYDSQSKVDQVPGCHDEHSRALAGPTGWAKTNPRKEREQSCWWCTPWLCLGERASSGMGRSLGRRDPQRFCSVFDLCPFLCSNLHAGSPGKGEWNG